MIRRPPRSTHCISSAASDVYKRQVERLYEMSEGALEYYRMLPKVIERMSAVKYLHEESAGLMNRIIAIEKAQATIQGELKAVSYTHLTLPTICSV
eukprot:TRINITY_DN2748_c0_g1_i19.p1 TRINITY_DN2748_c0_g1~~TRINITY_DN2748_c0_g1_i19.p1  ORF type:complete len:103 (-),score=47.22 TRINITY_DN2748_c0_g1_i19:45-332(-)